MAADETYDGKTAAEWLAEALAGRDSGRLTEVALSLNALGVPDVTELATAELIRQPHEIQRFWLGPCNCHGQLN